ncbi:snRNA-activating protein complex subunit-like [Nicotiana tabacum]|uniref:snRNA transcription factor n=2 Tax=Nicotiana TaxID=4085 RepID=A0A0D6CAF7_TOBAC|nr:snRNA-activating protein complex subunit-like [Nicotiana tabacum]XP_009605891.1 snRNA-activating protein complex subunit [Nicotiana tomentosiformis]BAQ95603.1 snRNA transcription factor [Nicotiana tabacum]
MSDPKASADEHYVSIPRGGPIYISDMVGPLTKVADFEVSIFRELERLKAELSVDSLEMFDDEISVEDLKTFSEEELVAQAFEEAFKDDELTKESSQTLTEHLDTRSEREVDSSTIHDPSDNVALDNKGSDKRKSNKRKRGKNVRQKNAVDEDYVLKVEQLAKIKEKQEEEKAAARLHSFNGSCGSSHSASTSSSKSGRMTSLKSISSGTKVRAANAHGHIAVHFPEVVLCIEVYHYKKTWVKTQEFLVLGRQFLTEMRDKIYCITDEIMKNTGQNDPSGYFLVEDVFCNDFRHPAAVNYSKPILNWLQDSKSEALEKWESIASGELPQKQKALLGSKIGPQLPHFKTAKMQVTRFCDLRFRLGSGYLYCHQGDCKHQVVIRDMRLIHPEDVQNRAAYPLITFQPKLRFQKCSVCKIFKAVKVTVDDKWAAENPCYFCDLCYYMLHYVNGSLLYDDFSVYEYLHE